MTLDDLMNETLVEKHRRLMQAKCQHEEVFSSSFCGPEAHFTDRFCLDCGKHWRIDHR